MHIRVPFSFPRYTLCGLVDHPAPRSNPRSNRYDAKAAHAVKILKLAMLFEDCSMSFERSPTWVLSREEWFSQQAYPGFEYGYLVIIKEDFPQLQFRPFTAAFRSIVV